MTTAATASAQPPERRRCGHSLRTGRRLTRARPESDRPPNRAPANANDHPPATRMSIDFATPPSFTIRSPREPGRTPKGGTA
jgi:hypothetical protein